MALFNIFNWGTQSGRNEFHALSKPYLLLDAGGTLVFPNQPLLIQEAEAYGIELNDEQLFSGFYHLIYALDCQARKSGSFPCISWPEDYARDVLESFGIDSVIAQTINQVVEDHCKPESLWTFTFPWVRETLDHLAAQGYHMSVISNSDGRAVQVFSNVGYTHYFDYIFDSTLLGVAKPDPGIFEKALHKLNLQPADALYIGDVFEVDVRGANAAGVGAVHLNPLGLYAGWPGVHLPDVRHLSDWLVRYADNPSNFDLFPFRRQAQTAVQVKQFNENLADLLCPDKIAQTVLI
jgi:HAD superfamily hydrolase (TIGR01549 family)